MTPADTHRVPGSAPTNRPARRLATRAAAALFIAVAGGVASLLPAAQASAQLSASVETFEPYKIVITDERAMVRCGPGAAYYPVVEALRVGSILTADGETNSGWLRVRYPDRATALVSADAVDVASEAKSATLVKPATLSAFNVSTGARGSWSKLLSEPLPAGTTLTVVREAFNDLTGELVGYEIEPPPESRAFIRGSFTRRATSADIANAPTDDPAGRPAGTSAAGAAGDAGAAAGTTEAAAEIADATAQTAQQAMQPVESQARPEPQPQQPDAAQPADARRPVAEPESAALDAEQADTTRPVTQPMGASNTAAPQADARQDAAEPADEPAPMTIRSLDDLEAAFAAVQAQPLAEAEFDQLVAEVERMLEAEEAASPLRGAIESRLNVLRIRQRVQTAWRANAEAAREAESIAGEMSDEIRRLEVERSYSAIGRLLPSAVYDGTRLPRMFRVQSVDTTEAPRTLGYIKPDPKLRLETMLNQTVGVVGTPRLDPRLNLLIIEPVKIDVIGAGG